MKAVAFDGGDYLLDDNASLPVQHIFAVYRGNFDRNDVMISNETNNLIQVYTDHGSRFLYGDFFKEDGGTIRVSGKDSPKYESHVTKTWQEIYLQQQVQEVPTRVLFINSVSGLRLQLTITGKANLGKSCSTTVPCRIRNAMPSSVISPTNGAFNCMPTNSLPSWLPMMPLSQSTNNDNLQVYYKFEPLAIEPNKSGTTAETVTISTCLGSMVIHGSKVWTEKL